jgi:drug/metabolite transporter (DMT)-like permease
MNRFLTHPYLLLCLTAACWGANAVAGKLAVGHVSPMMLTLVRWAIAIAIVLPFAWGPLRRDWPAVRANLPFLFALGVFGMALFNGLFYTALLYTSAVQATIVQSAMPLVVFIGMFLLFGQRVRRAQLIGFAITALGVAITAARGDLSSLLSVGLNRGDALMVVAVVLYAGYTVALGFRPKLHWLTMILVLSVGALVASVPMLVWEIEAGGYIAPDAQGWAVALFTAIFPSLVGQVLYIRGVEMIGASRANLFINFVPIFGAGLAVLVLAEPLLPYHFVALALVICGITIAERARLGAASQ